MKGNISYKRNVLRILLCLDMMPTLSQRVPLIQCAIIQMLRTEGYCLVIMSL